MKQFINSSLLKTSQEIFVNIYSNFQFHAATQLQNHVNKESKRALHNFLPLPLHGILWTLGKKIREIKEIVSTTCIELLLFVLYRKQLYLKLHILLVKHSFKSIGCRTPCLKLEFWVTVMNTLNMGAMFGSSKSCTFI